MKKSYPSSPSVRIGWIFFFHLLTSFNRPDLVFQINLCNFAPWSGKTNQARHQDTTMTQTDNEKKIYLVITKRVEDGEELQVETAGAFDNIQSARQCLAERKQYQLTLWRDLIDEDPESWEVDHDTPDKYTICDLSTSDYYMFRAFIKELPLQTSYTGYHELWDKMDEKQSRAFRDVRETLTKQDVLEGAKRGLEKPMGFLLTYLRDMYELTKSEGCIVAEALLKWFNIFNDAKYPWLNNL